MSGATHTADGLAVTGFFFQLSTEDNPGLSPLLERMGAVGEAHTHTALQHNVNVSDGGLDCDKLFWPADNQAGGAGRGGALLPLQGLPHHPALQ